MVLVKTILKSPLGDVNKSIIGIFLKKQAKMEPPVGHEPTTFPLPWGCSTN